MVEVFGRERPVEGDSVGISPGYFI